MSQLYIGAYQKIDNKYISIIEDGLHNPSDLPTINAIEPILIGSGVKSYRKLLEQKYGAMGVKFSDENNHSREK